MLHTTMSQPVLAKSQPRKNRGSSATNQHADVAAIVQPKLRISTPGDRHEREADRVAEQVVGSGQADSVSGVTADAGARLQRMCSECEEELQLKSNENSGGNTPAQFSGPIALGQGQSLSGAPRQFFESRMGADFSRVKIHTDNRADTMSRELNARAFTYGEHIAFADGEFNPQTFSGKKLIAHELTHVLQQSGKGVSLDRACLPAADCAGPIAGSAGAFGASEETRERPFRERRQRMTCARATATTHVGRARQLENLLTAHDPAMRAQIHGIFIDADLSPGTGAMVTDCAGWAAAALPAGCAPPAIAGAVKPCVFIHAHLNQEALLFNRGTAATIAGMSREDWRISTLTTLIHEVQHVVFNTSGRPEPPGAAACPRSSVAAEVTELNAIMSEFLLQFRSVPAAAGAARTRALARLNSWFNTAITNPDESIAGTLKAMRCACDCAEVNAHVRDIFNLVSASWTVAERNAFNAELRNARWNAAPTNLNWPL
jgi:hypothetical protein